MQTALDCFAPLGARNDKKLRHALIRHYDCKIAIENSLLRYLHFYALIEITPPTLADAISAICETQKQNPDCLARPDLNRLEALKRDAHWLLSESYRGPMNSPRHHQVYDRIHASLRALEKKCADYHYRKKRREVMFREEMFREEKYNENHKPAGSPNGTGGQFDNAPGGGGSGGSSPSGGESVRKPVRRPETLGPKPAAADEAPKPPHPREVAQRLRKPITDTMTPKHPKEMRASSNAVEKLIDKENFEERVYTDTSGHPTIGYGHKIRRGETFPNGVTAEEAEAILDQDVREAETAVRTLVKVPLTQIQFDALTSFTYNIGYGHFRDSEALQHINNGNHEAAADAFENWSRSGADPQRLNSRRRAEAEQFRQGIPPKK